MKYVQRTSGWIRETFPGISWNVKGKNPGVLLSFDDGPFPGATDWVLDVLREHAITGMFFCLGEQLEQHPQLFERIRMEGHLVGNHSFSHPDGWKTPTRTYVNDVRRAASLIPGNWFRPPYGRMSPGQYLRLRKNFRIMMWSIQVFDFNRELSSRFIWENLEKHMKEGDILVFHDKVYAQKERKELLLKCLRKIKDSDWDFSFE